MVKLAKMITGKPLIMKKLTGQMKGKLTELIVHLVIQANIVKEAMDLNLQQNYPYGSL